jgi:hypothetical protein
MKGDKILANSTLIRANASLQSMVARSEVFEPPRAPKEHVEQVFVENPVPTEAAAETDSAEQAPREADPGSSVE